MIGRINAALARQIDLSFYRLAGAPVRISVGLALLTLLVGGALFSWFEADADWVDGMYWVTVVMPTVGFGDFSPETLPGRLLYCWTVFVGFLVTLCLSGSLAASILARKAERADDTAEVGDDIERIKVGLSDAAEALEALSVICCTPRVRKALAEDHADRTEGEA